MTQVANWPPLRMDYESTCSWKACPRREPKCKYCRRNAQDVRIRLWERPYPYGGIPLSVGHAVLPRPRIGADVLTLGRFHPIALGMKALINRGELGTLTKIEISLAATGVKDNNVRWDYELGGGAMMDLGCEFPTLQISR